MQQREEDLQAALRDLKETVAFLRMFVPEAEVARVTAQLPPAALEGAGEDMDTLLLFSENEEAFDREIQRLAREEKKREGGGYLDVPHAELETPRRSEVRERSEAEALVPFPSSFPTTFLDAPDRLREGRGGVLFELSQHCKLCPDPPPLRSNVRDDDCHKRRTLCWHDGAGVLCPARL